MEHQISFSDLMTQDEEQPEITCGKDEKAYRIPGDVWETRCRYCVHKTGEKNIPIPVALVHKTHVQKVIPCRIMTVSKPGNEIKGECMSFTPKDVYGICETCKHNNIFHEGYCMKENHAEQHRVFYGNAFHYKPDYYGTHRLSVCADYEPVRHDLIRMEG